MNNNILVDAELNLLGKKIKKNLINYGLRNNSNNSFAVAIFDIESLTKVLYYLNNFWGSDEIFSKFLCNLQYLLFHLIFSLFDFHVQ